MKKPDQMTAPLAGVGLRPVAQPMAAPLTLAAIFLAVTVNPGLDNRAAVPSVFGDLSTLFPSSGISRPGSGLSCVVGFLVRGAGPALWTTAAGGTYGFSI
jgi:putative iron-dependent peroxidase